MLNVTAQRSNILHLLRRIPHRRHADRNDMTRYYCPNPSLHLTGNWLEAAGFATDTPVVISVEQGQLVIRIVTE
ncbi:SymE family type I addiction module toxin [Pectobacterium polaris]|uniref:SymE family type I addiction module toxin n=1 Tax=Pectobacterium polaris TaxID=2042057 RepID=UPI003463F57C